MPLVAAGHVLEGGRLPCKQVTCDRPYTRQIVVEMFTEPAQAVASDT
jgi:hypothetical protein